MGIVTTMDTNQMLLQISPPDFELAAFISKVNLSKFDAVGICHRILVCGAWPTSRNASVHPETTEHVHAHKVDAVIYRITTTLPFGNGFINGTEQHAGNEIIVNNAFSNSRKSPSSNESMQDRSKPKDT